MVIEDDVLSIIREHPQINEDEIRRRYGDIYKKPITYFEIKMAIENLEAKDLVSKNGIGIRNRYSSVTRKMPSQTKLSNVKKINHTYRVKTSEKSSWQENKINYILFGIIIIVISAIITNYLGL